MGFLGQGLGCLLSDTCRGVVDTALFCVSGTADAGHRGPEWIRAWLAALTLTLTAGPEHMAGQPLTGVNQLSVPIKLSQHIFTPDPDGPSSSAQSLPCSYSKRHLNYADIWPRNQLSGAGLQQPLTNTSSLLSLGAD